MPWTHDSERIFDPDEAHNLRRKRQRDTADTILARADFLPPPDRTLILAVYEDSRPVADLARMMGQDPRALRRRIRRLVQRMVSPRYAFVAARRDQWSSTRRRVATACVLHGLSLRAAADQLGLSHYTVRRHCQIIDALVEAARSWKHR